MIHTYLVCNSFVFFWKKSEKTKMAAVITDVFRHLVESLSEVNNAAVSVTPVDKIINDAVLVAFANKIIKNNYFLVVRRKFFEWNDFITVSLNNIITNLGIDFFSKVLQKFLIFVLVQVFFFFGKFYQTLTTQKAYAVIWLFYQNYWAHKLTSEKHLLAYKGDLACSHSWRNLGHNLESSFFFSLLYIHAGKYVSEKMASVG